MAAVKGLAGFDPKSRAKYLKLWKESAEGRNYVGVALALFRAKLTSGLARSWREKQGIWAPLSPGYARWKEKKSRGGIWSESGATLRSVTANPPSKVGTTRGVRFGINWYSDVVFIFPNRLGGRGKKALERKRIFGVLNYGSRRSRINRYLVSKGRSEQVTTGRNVPARPWLIWDRGDLEEIIKEVERELEAIFRRQGLR